MNYAGAKEFAMQDNEIWSPAAGYEDKFEVSTAGNVRSVERVVNSRYGSTRRLPSKMLKTWSHNGGYRAVQIVLPGGKRNILVHRMVAQTFIPNPHGKPFINHIDNDRANNCVQNLEWVTQAENIDHAQKQGRMKNNSGPGEKSPAAKLDWHKVSEIREKLSRGFTKAALAKEYNVSSGTIGFIAANKTWVQGHG
jgi:hypothetical protein